MDTALFAFVVSDVVVDFFFSLEFFSVSSNSSSLAISLSACINILLCSKSAGDFNTTSTSSLVSESFSSSFCRFSATDSTTLSWTTITDLEFPTLGSGTEDGVVFNPLTLHCDDDEVFGDRLCDDRRLANGDLIAGNSGVVML